jgi:uncharacterized membrane protein
MGDLADLKCTINLGRVRPLPSVAFLNHGSAVVVGVVCSVRVLSKAVAIWITVFVVAAAVRSVRYVPSHTAGLSTRPQRYTRSEESS